MKAVFTPGALADLNEILDWLKSKNPLAAAAVENSIGATVARVTKQPKSTRTVTQWAGNVRAVPLVRHPYIIFYQVQDDCIEILHIRHTARAPWREPTG
jgi:plasmid stabilization system protein ParE